jgi:hypothetical protein
MQKNPEKWSYVSSETGHFGQTAPLDPGERG